LVDPVIPDKGSSPSPE
jgi:hypothetical protein